MNTNSTIKNIVSFVVVMCASFVVGFGTFLVTEKLASAIIRRI